MAASADATPRPALPPGTYLGVLLSGSVLLPLVLQLWPRVVIGPVPGAGVVMIAFLAGAIIIWLREPRLGRSARGVSAFLLALLALWLYLLVLLLIRPEEVSIPAILPPLLLTMLWLRPLTRVSATWAADLFASVTIVVLAVSLSAEVVGLVGSWYGPNADLARLDQGAYWVPLAGPLGLDGRWAGPFVHPNLLGPVGAFLLVFGLARRGWRRVVFGVAGALVLLLAGSRTSFMGALGGVLALTACWWLARPTRLPGWLRVWIVLVPLTAAAAALFLVNPGLTGRTSVWPTMIDMWRDSPVTGVGDAGFADAIADGALPGWATHGHNVLLDAVVRTGLLGLALVVAVLGIALIVTLRGARHGHGVGLGIVVMLLVSSMTDTTLFWRYLTVPVAALVLAVLMSARNPVPRPTSAPHPSEPAPPPAPAQAPGSDQDPDRAPTA